VASSVDPHLPLEILSPLLEAIHPAPHAEGSSVVPDFDMDWGGNPLEDDNQFWTAVGLDIALEDEYRGTPKL
jgi:hypothetical protein